MGFQGVSFARCPGSKWQEKTGPSTYKELTEESRDKGNVYTFANEAANEPGSISGEATVMAAKWGTVDPSGLILRVYQPTSRPLTLTLSLGASSRAFSTIQKVIALEEPIEGERPAQIASNGDVSVSLDRALTTFLVKTDS